MKKKQWLYLLVAVLCLNSCASSRIVRLSPDTYILSRSSAAGMFVNMSRLKGKVIQEANAFAESKGKIAICLSSNEVRPVHGFPSFEYQFRVVEKDDPEARRTSLVPRPDIVIEKTEKISAEIQSEDISENDLDLYTELMKLDNLRKRGLITDGEFEAEKQKLLNRTK